MEESDGFFPSFPTTPKLPRSEHFDWGLFPVVFAIFRRNGGEPDSGEEGKSIWGVPGFPMPQESPQSDNFGLGLLTPNAPPLTEARGAHAPPCSAELRCASFSVLVRLVSGVVFNPVFGVFESFGFWGRKRDSGDGLSAESQEQ